MKRIVDRIMTIYFGMNYAFSEYEPGLEISTTQSGKYLGVYGSTTNPMTITIIRNDDVLIAQATGQPEVPLEAFEKDKFKFDQAGIIFKFIPEENKMILMPGGNKFELIKK